METAAQTDGCDLLLGRNPGPPYLSEIHARGGRGRHGTVHRDLIPPASGTLSHSEARKPTGFVGVGEVEVGGTAARSGVPQPGAADAARGSKRGRRCTDAGFFPHRAVGGAGLARRACWRDVGATAGASPGRATGGGGGHRGATGGFSGATRANGRQTRETRRNGFLPARTAGNGRGGGVRGRHKGGRGTRRRGGMAVLPAVYCQRRV